MYVLFFFFRERKNCDTKFIENFLDLTTQTAGFNVIDFSRFYFKEF